MFSARLSALLAACLLSQTTYAWFRVGCGLPIVTGKHFIRLSSYATLHAWNCRACWPHHQPWQHHSNESCPCKYSVANELDRELTCIRLFTGGSVRFHDLLWCFSWLLRCIDFSANYTYNNLRASSCSNCPVQQDMSNYWFPKLYFHNRQNITYTEVPNGGKSLLRLSWSVSHIRRPRLGLLVYYQNRGDGDKSNGGSGLKAFPAGLKMITGSPTRRSRKWFVFSSPIKAESWTTERYTAGAEGTVGTQAELAERAIQWICLRYSAGLPDYDYTSTCE